MPSTNELVLHVGMHKTGSTSIQSSLKQYDDGRIRMARLGEWNHSVPMYTMFSSDPYSYQQHSQVGRTTTQVDQLRDQYFNKLSDELGLRRDKLIISGEDISLLDAKGVSAMHEYFKDKVSSIRVVAYVRAPLGFASSALQQYVRGGIRHALIPTPNYRQRFEPLIEEFGIEKITFEKFHRNTLAGDSVVSDFCIKTGINSQTIKDKEKNESVSFQATQLVLHFNQYGVPSTGNPDLRRARTAFLWKLSDMYKAEPKFNLPASEVWQASDLADVEWMQQRSGIQLLDDAAKATVQGSIGEASNALKANLSNISETTLRVLQHHVMLIDEDVGKSANVTNLLNVLFMALYFEHKRRQRVGFSSMLDSGRTHIGKLVKKPIKFMSKRIRSQAT